MNKIEQQIEELRRMAKGKLEAIDCNFCDDDLADTMQALYDESERKHEALMQIIDLCEKGDREGIYEVALTATDSQDWQYCEKCKGKGCPECSYIGMTESLDNLRKMTDG